MARAHIISSEKDRYELALLDGSGERIFAHARGVFRQKGTKPMIGDYVDFIQEEGAEEATIRSVEERKNLLLRPPVANVDQVLVLTSLREPKLNRYALDKLLVVLEKRGFPVLLCFNKMDRTQSQDLEVVQADYRLAGYPVFAMNSLTGEGRDALYARLRGKLTAIAGPSGAGKSTFIRLLSGEDSIRSGELSPKTDRGRQTTRTSRLFPLGEESYIFDTPGFSTIDLRDFSKPEELKEAFIELPGLAKACRFRNCLHREEPGCAVKEALNAGRISPERYRSYRMLLEELIRERSY